MQGKVLTSTAWYKIKFIWLLYIHYLILIREKPYFQLLGTRSGDIIKLEEKEKREIDFVDFSVFIGRFLKYL